MMNTIIFVAKEYDYRELRSQDPMDIDDIISLMDEDDFFDILTEYLELFPRNRDIAKQLIDVVDGGWDLLPVYDTLFIDFKEFLEDEEQKKLDNDYRSKFDIEYADLLEEGRAIN